MWQSITRMLASIDDATCPLRPTAVYNEGWMLRLVLDHLQGAQATVHPFAFTEGSRWFSEALLPSPFEREGWTNADGVIGNFSIGKTARLGFLKEAPISQFCAIEAKMFSGLSPGVKCCPSSYNQAARTVACMAQVLANAGQKPNADQQLAFYVVAPSEQITAHVFGDRVTRTSILEVVSRRVDTYGGQRDQWFREWFEPTLSSMLIKLLSWEDVLDGLPETLRRFYDRCRDFNRKRR